MLLESKVNKTCFYYCKMTNASLYKAEVALFLQIYYIRQLVKKVNYKDAQISYKAERFLYKAKHFLQRRKIPYKVENLYNNSCKDFKACDYYSFSIVKKLLYK